MILFLPINVYRAHYQVAKGRPYSAFERILLSAVAERDQVDPARGAITTAMLAADLFVPERLVIEGVATLLEAEWIALNESNLLEVTSAGRSALAEPGRLPPDMVLRDSSAWIVQERLCGQTILQEGVSYERRDKLEKEGRWDKEQALPPSDSVPNSLDPGQVVPLLHVSDSAYLSWVGPVDIHHSGGVYLIVTVNPDKEIIANLPRAWEPALRDQLISHARFLRDERRERGIPAPDETWVKTEYEADKEAEPTPAAWQVPADSLTFLRSAAEHGNLLLRTLQEDDYLFIASTTLNESVIRPLLPCFLSALGRGATIDILFGNELGEPSRPALDLLKKLAYDSARQGSGGRLLVNHVPSGCHANVLLRARYSKDHTTAAAVFGAHSWLADPGQQEDLTRSLSLHMTHEAPVAYLCRLMADFAVRDSQLSTGSAPTRLPNLAAALDRRLIKPISDTDDDPVLEERPRAPLLATRAHPVVRVWLERQLRAAMEHLAKRAQRGLLLLSPELEPVSALGELALMKGTKGTQTLMYGRATWNNRVRGLIEERITKTGGTVTLLQDLRTSLLIGDEAHMVLSSHSWLAPFPPVLKTMSSTIGIEVEGLDATHQVLPWLLRGELT